MSLLARLIRNEVVTDPSELLRMLRGGAVETDSGVFITEETAMRISTVYACVRVLSEDIAKLPLIVYNRLDRGRQRAADYWLTDLLEEPNPWQTGMEFREMLSAHLELAGVGYAIKTTVRGEVRELLPVVPMRVKPELLPNYRVVYHVTWPDGREIDVPGESMFVVRGLTLDGFRGVSPITYQRETMGLALQQVRYAAKLFKQGASLRAALEHPGRMTDDAYRRLKDSFEQEYAGATNAQKTILLEEGTKFVAAGMSNDDAQFIESRKFSRSEVCGIYRVPPHKIADLERSTNNNIEQQAIEYLTDALLPRLRRWETRIRRDLIPRADRKTFFAEFLVDGVLRGDFITRMNGYRIGVMSGWITRNEVREKENLNPGPPDLDEFLTPLNMNDPGRQDAGAPPASGSTGATP